MVKKSDFGQREVEASKSVLVELIHILGEFKDALVVIGGSVPPLLYPDTANEYVGTLDVDLVINHQQVDDETYQTIREVLMKSGYRPKDEQPFIFFRKVLMPEGDSIEVQVDLLSGEYGGTGRSHRTQKIQDIRARKARGSDLAFDLNKEVEIEALLPQGGKDKVRCKISATVPFIVMKAMAMASRLKEKDAYDIYYCLTHHPGELDALIHEFLPLINHKLVLEGLVNIAEKFESPNHIGPKHIADFLEIIDSEEKERVQRDAYERANYLLKSLGII